MEEERETMEGGVKLHRKGRITTAPTIKTDDDVFTYQVGRSTGIIKFLEPLNPLLNYFEYLILEKGRETAIGVGCGERSYPMSRMPGWNRNGCGYHADDGKLYHESGMGRAFGPRCTTGDRMGCGIIFDGGLDNGTVEVFFTKNGQQVGEVERMKRPLHGLYPLIGLHSVGEKIRYLGHWRRLYSTDGAIEPMEQDNSPDTRWLRCNGIRFLSDGLSLEYAGVGGAGQDVGIAQSRYPLTISNHYFELEIVEEGALGAIALGLGKTTYPLHRHPGWNPGGVGYHADDGKLFKGLGQGDPFGPKCTVGDRMGCGVKFEVDPEGEGAAGPGGGGGGGGSESEESETEGEADGGDVDRLPQLHELLDQDSSDDDDSKSSLSSESEESYSGDSIANEMIFPEPLVGFGDERLFAFGGGRRGGGRGGFRQRQEAAMLRRMFDAQRRAVRPQRPARSKVHDGDRPSCLVYFTKNGEMVGEVECEVPRGGFYPMVAMLSQGEKVRVDFNPLTG